VEGALSSSDEKRYVEELKIAAPTQIDFDFANHLLVLPQEIDSSLKGYVECKIRIFCESA